MGGRLKLTNHVGHDPQDFFSEQPSAEGVTGTLEKVRLAIF